MSNSPSINSLRELNTKLLAEICELRKKFVKIEGENAEIPKLRKELAEVEAENAKLRHVIEENARHTRVEELEQKNTEFETRLEILTQDSLADGMALSSGQQQNDREVTPEVLITRGDGISC